ncbi:MAG: hypothetical protein R3B06_01505 [Kofleriaceae bacterium]
MHRALCLALALVVSTACGGHPPPPVRGVGETAIADWQFRRFQEVLDIEVWVPDNTAVAYTATYVAGAAEHRGQLGDDDLTNVFVTRYQRDDGVVRATVKFARRLAQEAGYTVDEDRVAGVRLLRLEGNGELWGLWSAKGHVVKVGGRGRTSLPGAVIGWYGDRYPSTVPAGALEGPLPAGPDQVKPADPDAPYDPDAPTPDWDTYDPGKTKVPTRTEP